MTPPAAPNLGSQLAVLTERIEQQGATLIRLEQSLSAIERRLSESENHRSNFNAEYQRSHAILENKADSAHRRIDEHVQADLPKWAEVDILRNEVKQLHDIVLSLQHSNRLIAWFGGLVGASIVAWIISNLLGLI